MLVQRVPLWGTPGRIRGLVIYSKLPGARVRLHDHEQRSLIQQMKAGIMNFDSTTIQERKNTPNVSFSSGTSDLYTLSGLFHPLTEHISGVGPLTTHGLAFEKCSPTAAFSTRLP